MTGGRWVLAVSGVLLLVGGAAGGYLLSRDQEDPDLCTSVQAARDELLDRPFEGGGEQSVLVIGDSYSQGTGVGGPAGAWPAALAELSGATVTVDGMNSTGYTTTGFCPGEPFTYAERLADHDVADYTTLVLQGSVNDGLTGEPGEVEAGAEAALEAARDAGRIVVVGPPTIPGLDAAELATIDGGLAAAAEAHDAVYVSLLAAAVPISDDLVHPTAEGQDRIALAVAGALGRLPPPG
jgi:lysophospholipase L1-like esterase